MIISPGFIGIDVSKDHLDIFAGTALRIANTPEAVAAWIAGIESPRLVLFEATGRYDRVLLGYETQPLPASHRLAEMLGARALFQ